MFEQSRGSLSNSETSPELFILNVFDSVFMYLKNIADNGIQNNFCSRFEIPPKYKPDTRHWVIKWNNETYTQ